MKLLIIESPGKREKLQEILAELFPGQHWRIEASFGHVRDLPARGGQEGHIVAGVTRDFQPVYELTERGGVTVAKLKGLTKDAEEIYLATDADREGESISWHLEQSLGLKGSPKTFRISFNEITKACVREAFSKPGRVNMPKVEAQEARRILDRLVGYMVSPELKRQTGQSLSAGRVQSPAVRLVVEREREIRNFKPTTHYGVQMVFADAKTGEWGAEWETIPDYATKESPYVLDPHVAEQVAKLRCLVVENFEEKEASRNPPPPFITSTLQQAASNRFRFDPKKTMQIAQALYEQGHISYHRTDNPNVSEESMPDIRAVVANMNLSMPPQRRVFKAKDGAQEGHPAITPTHWEVESAGETEEQQQLYKMIRVRAIASQLHAARYAVRKITLKSVAPFNEKIPQFEGEGRTLVFAGWLSLLSSDATNDDEDEKSGELKNPIPFLSLGTVINADRSEVIKKTTRAPKRYTKASIVKALEARGIGRPATFASIMDNIESREYIKEEKLFLYPTNVGETVVDSLVGKFRFIDFDFTRDLEEDLDKIANSNATYREVIQKLHARLDAELGARKAAAPSASMPTYSCPCCEKPMRRLKGSNGHFWGCTAYPECKTTRPDSGGKPVMDKKISAAPPKSQVAQLSPFKCLKCGKQLIHKEKKGAGGYDLWGCSGFSTGCRTMYPNAGGQPDYKRAK